MGRNSGGIRNTGRPKRSSNAYYAESKRLRKEALQLAEKLVGNPMRFTVTNGIRMDVEITKADIKTIVGKATDDNKFNAIKNALARNIPSFLKKAEYVGWRPTDEGKHIESAYFTYHSRELGAKSYLVMRKLKKGGPYKPYAIINQKMFNEKIKNVRKGNPPE